MANFTVKDPPEFNNTLRKLETTDPAHADTFNALLGQLINNDAFLAALAQKTVKALAEHLENSAAHVTAQNKQAWDAKAGTAVATQSAAGLMGAGDKQKLDNVETGAEVNQNAYSNVKVGNITITANGKTATFTLEAGSNITLAADNAAKKITFAANRDGGNADMVDGYHAAHFAAADHGHDGRYNTKAEITTLLSQKAASSHSHTRASIIDFPESMPPTTHTHDDRYYTEAEVSNLLADKAAANHGHKEVDELKKSVSDGKKSVAAAVTAKGITTAADATFATIAANIGKIMTAGGGTGKDVTVTGDITSGTAGITLADYGIGDDWHILYAENVSRTYYYGPEVSGGTSSGNIVTQNGLTHYDVILYVSVDNNYVACFCINGGGLITNFPSSGFQDFITALYQCLVYRGCANSRPKNLGVGRYFSDSLGPYSPGTNHVGYTTRIIAM